MRRISCMTMDILRLLADGPKTTTELCAATGRTHKQVGSVLSWLASRNGVSLEPARYSLTEEGIARAEWTPKTPPKALARQRKYADKKAEIVKVEKRQKSMVRAAIESQHPLAAAWSSHA